MVVEKFPESQVPVENFVALVASKVPQELVSATSSTLEGHCEADKRAIEGYSPRWSCRVEEIFGDVGETISTPLAVA